MTRTITRTQVRDFLDSTEALLGRGARRISGSVDVVNGIVITENLRYLTHVGEVTVSASSSGAPMLFDQNNRQVSTYAPPEESVMSVSSLELIGGQRAGSAAAWKITRIWDALKRDRRVLAIAATGAPATGAFVTALPIALLSPAPFLGAFGGCLAVAVAGMSTLPMATARHRQNLLTALVTDLRPLGTSFVRDLQTTGITELLDEPIRYLTNEMEHRSHRHSMERRFNSRYRDSQHWSWSTNRSQQGLEEMKLQHEEMILMEMRAKETASRLLGQIRRLQELQETAVATAVVLHEGELHQLFVTRSEYEMIPINPQGKLRFPN